MRLLRQCVLRKDKIVGFLQGRFLIILDLHFLKISCIKNLLKKALLQAVQKCPDARPPKS